MKETFTEDKNTSDFNKDHFESVINMSIRTPEEEFLPFSTKEIFKGLNKLKINSSPGGDGLKNIFIKKLPFE